MQGLLIETYVKSFHDYTMASKLLERVFDYLTRFYLKDKPQKLGDIALDIFKRECFTNFKVPLLKKILEMFHSDRNQNIIDKQILEKAVKSYV